MIDAVPEPASTLIAAAAFTGARRGELRGMFWENYRDGELLIARSIWNGITTDPKSKAPIPIIPKLATKLAVHRAHLGKPKTGPIFPNGLARRSIPTACCAGSFFRRLRSAISVASKPPQHLFRRGEIDFCISYTSSDTLKSKVTRTPTTLRMNPTSNSAKEPKCRKRFGVLVRFAFSGRNNAGAALCAIPKSLGSRVGACTTAFPA